VDTPSIVQAIGNSFVGEWLRTSVKAEPIVEAIHVFTSSIVFGTILIVDLRLLGLTGLRRPFTRVEGELIKYTWSAFIVSVITGSMMFAANAATYYANWPFRLKMLALLGAGLNMLYFERVTKKTVAHWNVGTQPPLAARLGGATSLVIWIAVIFLARWIGFTKGYNYAIPPDVDLNFDFPQ
jgi:Family of unknown function (DUF6644)